MTTDSRFSDALAGLTYATALGITYVGEHLLPIHVPEAIKVAAALGLGASLACLRRPHRTIAQPSSGATPSVAGGGCTAARWASERTAHATRPHGHTPLGRPGRRHHPS